MLMPFILRHFLTPADIISTELTTLCDCLSSSDSRRISTSQAINCIISCWVTVADAATYCFKLQLSTDDLDHLQNILIEEWSKLLQVIFEYF